MSRWQLAPGVKRYGDSTLAGGTPYRIVQLTGTGTMALDTLLENGSRPAPGSAQARLAVRLVRSGLLVPPLPEPVRPIDVTVVVPAHSSAGAMRRLLAAIPADVPVVVVDDASPDPLDALATGRSNVVVVRHPRRRGAAAARNTGAGLATTRWLVFADSDIEPPDGWLGSLLAVAGEPSVVAAAPRILNMPVPGLAGLVESHASALDMGVVPLDVGPGSAVTFVPTAVLLVDRASFLAVGGFDESMKVGEDVDLVWRLARRGRVRYEPRIQVPHRARRSLRAVLARRSFYGESVGLLEVRHPGAIRYAELPVRSLVPWLLGVLVHPAAGVAAAGLAVAATPRAVRSVPLGVIRRLTVRGQVGAVVGLGQWLVRPLLPLTAVAMIAAPAPLRRRLGYAIAAGYLDVAARAGLTSRRAGASVPQAALVAAETVVARVLDDVGQSAGVWRGCLTARSPGPLWPRVRR